MASRQSKPEVACVILAAGLGRRFEGPKMLHMMPSGLTMIEQTIEQYRLAFSKIHIVVCEQDEAIKQCISRYSNRQEKLRSQNQSSNSFRIVECADSNKGMSVSLVAGVSATIEADGWLIGLGDMPYLASETIIKLKSNLHESNIVMPRYRQRLGNPVGFGSQFEQQLLALEGDKGGKSITQQYSQCVSILDTQDQGVVSDIDTLEAVR